MYTVTATVKSVRGKCIFHKEGDEIVYDGRTIKGQFCGSAFMAMMPTMYAMRYGAEFPWFDDKDTTSFACPDPDNPVIFELKRVEDERRA